jgi:hypothetical protein
MRDNEQLSSSWDGTVHLNSFHIFTKKTMLLLRAIGQYQSLKDTRML